MKTLMDTDKMCFVFGSNESGIHGAGAALYALKFKGAKEHQGFGLMANENNSCFAIPTKNWLIKSMPLRIINLYVERFMEIAAIMKYDQFQITKIGCGLAGFKDEDMARLFHNAPNNCYFDTGWKKHLRPHQEYWGNFD